MRVVVLGAGFGGLELTSRLYEELGDDVEVVFIDRSEEFVFGFSKLNVMSGRTSAAAVAHAFRDIITSTATSSTPWPGQGDGRGGGATPGPC